VQEGCVCSRQLEKHPGMDRSGAGTSHKLSGKPLTPRVRVLCTCTLHVIIAAAVVRSDFRSSAQLVSPQEAWAPT